MPLVLAQLQAAVSPNLRGDAALQRHDIAAAVAFYREAAASDVVLRRAIGERMLAVIDRRYHRDLAGAHVHLARALATSADSALALDEAARLALDERRWLDAFDLARRARAAAARPEVAHAAPLPRADALLAPARARGIDGEPVAMPRALADSAVVVLAALDSLVRALPGRTDDARRLLLVALVAGDGARAASAVASYYRTARGDGVVIGDAIAESVARLRARGARAGPDAGLAAALARARLFDAAALVAPRHSEIVAYARFCRRVARESDEYYRATLVEHARFDRLLRAFTRASTDLWPHLAWPGAPPPFYPAAVAPELARRFGAVLQFGVTGGFYDLHMGHVVADTVRSIAQYGHRVRLHSLTLDGMVSNGLQSWAWGAAGAHGGWQRADTIVEVRPVYVDHAVNLWLGDSTAEARERTLIAADSAADLVLVAADSTGFLPGVAARLRRDARTQLLDSLRAAGLTGPSLYAAFVGITASLLRESSIVDHEARHAIDDRLDPTLAPAEREFRAKLSEVAFAAHPRLVLSAIVHPNIGDATPHGQANVRVMRGLVRWMRAHAAEIPGWDPVLPPLLQLPKLGEEQLRRAFRAMDPLASA